MKYIGLIILHIFRYLIVILLLLFSIATFVGHSYLQTVFIWLIVVAMIYWPRTVGEKLGKGISLGMRLACIGILFCISFLAFKPVPKSSIYLSEELKNELMTIYDQKVTSWPENTEDIYIESTYGTVHVLACGNTENPPLVMIHAASMGAHSWAENLGPLIDHYRIYSVDNIGEGNKSVLRDALVYPRDQKEIADHFALINNRA